MTQELSCFKAYDIRGRLGDELNEDIAYRIGRAFAEFLQPKTVVVGGDVVGGLLVLDDSYMLGLR